MIFKILSQRIKLSIFPSTKYINISSEDYNKLYRKLCINGTFKMIDTVMSNETYDRIIRAQKLLQILDHTPKRNREICLIYILKSYGNHFY